MAKQKASAPAIGHSGKGRAVDEQVGTPLTGQAKENVAVTQAVARAAARANERAWQQQWLAAHPGRTIREYRAGLSDFDGEVWEWRRAQGAAGVAAERAAWLQYHPGRPLPEHLCSLTETEYAEYVAWLASYRRKGAS
jgi:hypothetical protein